jgi:hypothetical protein
MLGSVSTFRHSPARDVSTPGATSRTSTLAEVASLAEPTTVQTPEELLVRLRRLEQALRGDGRVVFPAVYVAITAAAVRLVNRGPIADRARSRALIVDFGRRYLRELHNDVTGKPVAAHWRTHFERAKDAPPSLRGAMAAINAHLTVDLAEAVFAVGADRSFAGDFAAFGSALADATPDVIAALARHGVDGATFLRAGLAGDVIDAVAGRGTTSRLMFQTVRAEAFTNAMNLRACSQHPGVTRAGMNAAAVAREATLDVLLGCGPAPSSRSTP